MNQKGFTIVEMMIATVVFSMVLLLCSMAIIHIGRMYYKGMISNRTQDVARKLVDDVMSTVQLGSGDSSTFVVHRPFDEGNPNDGRWVYCLGRVRYTYDSVRALGGGSEPAKHVLWKDRVESGACTPADLNADKPSDNGVELLGTNMRLPVFEIETNDNRTWNVHIRVSYGEDDDLFEEGSGYGICKGVNAGGQFCAVSEFSTAVTRRIL